MAEITKLPVSFSQAANNTHFSFFQLYNYMATKDKTAAVLKLNVGKVHSEYLPALNLLFKMQGGSLQFKLKVKSLRDELSAKHFDALQSVRESDGLRKLAQTDKDKVDTEERFQNQFADAIKKEIEVSSAKIPLSLLPSEQDLAKVYTVQNALPNGQVSYEQGDYTTLIATIYDELIVDDSTVQTA